MASGRLRYSRELLLSEGAVIRTLFDKDASCDRETFIKYGLSTDATTVVERLSGEVHEKAAKFLREGKVTFN